MQLCFGGLFCGYAIYRGNHPEIFQWGSHLLDRKLGALNTIVLICSSGRRSSRAAQAT